MYKIEPPFEERELDEIISIAHSTTEEWVPEIRELAKRELIRRNVSLEMQNEIINKWNQDLQEWLTNNSTESYSKWEMIKIIILAPAYLTCRAIPNLSLSDPVPPGFGSAGPLGVIKPISASK